MSARPTFSVLIPAYQAAATIERAVVSALDQTLPAHEVIVCDDGSTDEIDAALAPHVERIRLIRQPNQGLSAARNAAGRAASGDWVVLLDADDEWLPTRLERIAEVIALKPTVDIVTTDALVRTPGQPDWRWYDKHSFPGPDDPWTVILTGASIFAGAAIRRSILDRLGWFTVGLPHDSEWEAWVRLMKAGSRAALVDEPLAVYHVHDAPRLSRRRAAHHRMGVAVFESLLGSEGPVLDALLERLLLDERRALAVAEGVEAVRGGNRRGCLAAAANRSVPARLRLRFALASLMPRLASTRL